MKEIYGLKEGGIKIFLCSNDLFFLIFLLFLLFFSFFLCFFWVLIFLITTFSQHLLLCISYAFHSFRLTLAQ
jgi:hypothetical protein